MKYVIYTFLVFVLIGTVSYGAVKIAKQDILKKDNIATVYPEGHEISVYKLVDDKTTCYIATTNKSVVFEMSCVK